MYTQSITRSHRTAFFLAIDCSGSMAEPIHFRGGCKAKSEVVATIANELLFELIERARRIRDLAAEWVLRPENAESFPPVVFNITDGEATDCDGEELRTVAEQIRSLATADGNVLLVNIHIATAADMRPLLFPEPSEEHYANRYASLLYDCSSTMPEPFHAAIRELKGAGALPPFRGLCFNASAAELVSALNIGSISVKTE